MACSHLLWVLVALHALYGVHLVYTHAGPAITSLVDAAVAEEEAKQDRDWLAKNRVDVQGQPSGPEFDVEWALRRVREGKPVRIAAAGLSRSGSTWQFNALRLILKHAVRTYGQVKTAEVHSAHGHTMDEIQGCLTRAYCVVKVHEFMPDVLARVDAIFLTHRDPRDVLLSSAQKISSCLAYGTQPLLSAFTHYASWLPYACFDMRYESMIAEGAAATLREHLTQLGLPTNFSVLTSLTRELHELTHKPKQTEADAQKTGMMPGHVTMVTTDPGAHDVFAEHVGTFSKYCDLPRELGLIEQGWGAWLVSQGYEDPGDAKYGSNTMVEALPQYATLMGHRPVGWRGGFLGARCPRTTDWASTLRDGGVWRYSQLRVNRSLGAPHYNAQAAREAERQARRAGKGKGAGAADAARAAARNAQRAAEAARARLGMPPGAAALGMHTVGGEPAAVRLPDTRQLERQREMMAARWNDIRPGSPEAVAPTSLAAMARLGPGAVGALPGQLREALRSHVKEATAGAKELAPAGRRLDERAARGRLAAIGRIFRRWSGLEAGDLWSVAGTVLLLALCAGSCGYCLVWYVYDDLCPMDDGAAGEPPGISSNRRHLVRRKWARRDTPSGSLFIFERGRI